MGLFSSLKKSSKIAGLQSKILPKRGSLDYRIKEKAKSDYFDYIHKLEGIRVALGHKGYSRNHLIEIVDALIECGGLIYIKGHLVAYSSVAYAAPLRYCMEMMEEGIGGDELIIPLIKYWEGNLTDLELMRYAGFDC